MKFSVKMTSKDLFEFSMYNSYSGGMGLFNVIFTAAALALLIFTWNWGGISIYQKLILVFCCLIFTVIQPLMLHFKAKKQAEMIGFSAPVNLTFTDENILVEQAGVEGDMDWSRIWKVVRIPSMMIIKVGPSHGYLIPNRSMDGQEEALVALFRSKLPEKKTKGLKV